MRHASSIQAPDDLQNLIKNRFSEFNRRSAPSRGRKYPTELRELVCQGIAAGIRPVELKRLTGMSQTAIRFALSNAKPIKPKMATTSAKLAKPRLLEVVGFPSMGASISTLIIRLPSGISIELLDPSMLTPALQAAQSSLEVNHASSR